ncbi:MAG TPA: flagellar basal body protein [Aquabacterium sp.]|nr:flagellar basal body protein [Aquabacterium sp.]
MTILSTTALGGMQAALAAIDVAGHNIANLATPGFRRQFASTESAGAGGVTTRLDQAARAGNAIEADMVDQLVAKNHFLANLAVFKTSDQLMGTLLDAKG